MRTRRIRTVSALALALLVPLAISSCSGNDSDDASSAIPTQDASGPPNGNDGSGSATTDTKPRDIDLAVAKRPADDRQVISTAQLELQARDIEETVGRATTAVAEAGGFVFSESSSLTSEQQAHVVYKVPPDEFDGVLAQIAKLGKLVHRRIGTEDVTGRVVDLGARLAAAQTSAERLRELLADSGSVADLLSVENQLSAREAEIESLAAQLAALRARVDLATVTVDVGPLTKEAAAAPAREQPGFQRGLRAGAAAFAGSARVVSAAVGLVLPFLPVVLLAALAGWLVRRRGAAKAPAS
jgi:hypothetical protein